MVLGIVAVTTICTFPNGASAKSGYFVIPESRSMEIRLKGSGGYSISVFGSGGQVSLTATRGNSSAVYSARGVTTSTRIKARFGGLRRVSVRFHPTRPAHLVPELEGNCKGRGEVVQPGRFVGRIEFEGEQGYTTVHASRAMGKVARELKQTCSRETEEGRNPLKVRWTFLDAISEAEGVFFTAARIVSKPHPRLDGSVFGASVIELRPRGLSIVRSLSASAGLDAFAATGSGGELASATITPPPPFKGTATYQKAKGLPATWTGSLVGDFLGRGEVSLVGPEFSVEISH